MQKGSQPPHRQCIDGGWGEADSISKPHQLLGPSVPTAAVYAGAAPCHALTPYWNTTDLLPLHWVTLSATSWDLLGQGMGRKKAILLYFLNWPNYSLIRMPLFRVKYILWHCWDESNAFPSARTTWMGKEPRWFLISDHYIGLITYG